MGARVIDVARTCASHHASSPALAPSNLAASATMYVYEYIHTQLYMHVYYLCLAPRLLSSTSAVQPRRQRHCRFRLAPPLTKRELPRAHLTTRRHRLAARAVVHVKEG